ncbi:MAG: CBS domain-containing protein [Nanoarchaeota archaeon]
MKVRDIMRPVFTIDSKSSVADAATLMSKNHTHSVVVVSNNKIVGILTEDDVFDNLDSLDEKVVDVMIKEVKTISDGEELSEAAEIMNREGVKKLPVLKGEKLVGMITATDLIAHAGELSEIFLFD